MWRVGGRQSNAQYQFTMQGDNLDDLNIYALMVDEFKQILIIADVSSDQQNRASQKALIQYDRDTAGRFGHHAAPDRYHAVRRNRQRCSPTSGTS